MKDSEIQLLMNAAVDWINANKDKAPAFSTACGMVFNDNSDADDFDCAMGEFAYKNGITLAGPAVAALYFEAFEVAAKQQEGA